MQPRVDPNIANSGLLRAKLLVNSRLTSSLLPAAGVNPASVVAAGAHAIPLSIFALATTSDCKVRVETLAEKKLVGKRLRMSLADNRTGELWRSFMPGRREISHTVTPDLYSMQVYSQPVDFGNLHQEFDKWAAVEVSDVSSIPEGMEAFVLKGGLYAVFPYKGSSTDTTIFRHIFGTWLPGSGYTLDSRPHFEVLGEKYKNADPNSEEEIWIPIKPRDDVEPISAAGPSL